MPDKSNSCNFQVMAAEWPCLPGALALMRWLHQALAWAGLAEIWAGAEWAFLPDPHILLQGSYSLGFFCRCSRSLFRRRGVWPPMKSCGNPILFCNMFLSLFSLQESSNLTCALGWQCTYSDLLHMLLLFSSPNLKSDSSFEENVFLFCQVLSLTCLSKQFSQG